MEDEKYLKLELKDKILRMSEMTLSRFCRLHGFNRQNLTGWFHGHKDLRVSTLFRLIAILELETIIDNRLYKFDDSSPENNRLRKEKAELEKWTNNFLNTKV